MADLSFVVANFLRDYGATVTLTKAANVTLVHALHPNGREAASSYWTIDKGVSERHSPNRDAYLYYDIAKANTFSHPAQSGALSFVLKSFVEAGKFCILSANERLDETDQRLVREAEVKRRGIYALTDTPIQGDCLRYPDGYIRRVAQGYDDGCQPASWGGQGSINLDPRTGRGSYSGALNSSVPHSELCLAPDMISSRFWMFSHNHATAHNGVDVYVPVRVWDVAHEDTDTRKMS